ncbi:hypothetical protein B9T34_00510 [Acinetobacter sp. ANC 3813]|nr:hypothetical protein B9T34_00510 [Acinetobacter sp. ANC 3813]
MQLHLPVLNQHFNMLKTDPISYVPNYNTLIFIVSKFYLADKFIKFKILVSIKEIYFSHKKNYPPAMQSRQLSRLR